MKKFILALMIASQVKLDSICTQAMLITELNEDIGDDGFLQCERLPVELKNTVDPVKAAYWTSDCAFEA